MGDSGVTVIMAASQAVDPGSTPGCRTELIFFSFFKQLSHFFPAIYLFSMQFVPLIFFLGNSLSEKKKRRKKKEEKSVASRPLVTGGRVRLGIKIIQYGGFS